MPNLLVQALIVASISLFENSHDFIAMCYPLLINSTSVIVCLINGLWVGLIIGFVTKYCTRNAYSPIQGVTDSCMTGTTTNVILGWLWDTHLLFFLYLLLHLENG